MSFIENIFVTNAAITIRLNVIIILITQFNAMNLTQYAIITTSKTKNKIFKQ